MRRVGINDRIDAAREAEKAQIDAANRKAAEEEEMRRQLSRRAPHKAPRHVVGPIRLAWQQGPAGLQSVAWNAAR
jgi:hypothetical protein